VKRSFSNGIPRVGQWVIIKGETVGVAVKRMTRNAAGVFESETWPVGQARVELLDETGLVAQGQMLFPLADLEPLLDKKLIPEKRRATMDPAWEPKP
jgi:hypothetical protein